ncbi:protein Shroom isoform X2 [Ochlerotatus camptorhynchus]|uniref:protein Shroom isoform X2 n=1 Tax=Ochlerotatus camptorhynchus TaxID=644619 RepID=UPI0031E02029
MDRFSVNNGSANAGGGTSTSGAVVNSTGNNAASGGASSIVTATSNSNINNTGSNNNNSNNNNGVKLRPDRGNASIDSTLSSASSSSSTVASVASSYRRSFHRLGPGSASATSDYSMSTLPESIQDEQHPSNGAGDAHTAHHGGSRLQQLTGPPGSGAGMASHNTSGLPGLLGPQNNSSLTQAGLEEYSRSYYEQTMYHHQKQSSYAQSEGYHSYVSSSDSSSTPFLDRLRQDSELLLSRSSHNWSQQDLQQLSSSSNSIGDNNSSESTSSTETLKWLGSMSDVSEASHATSMSALSSAGSTSQLIAHSSRVRTPQRHNSESILFMTTEEQQQHQQQQQQQQHLLHQHQALLGSSHQSPAAVGLVSQSMVSLHHHHSHPPHYLNGSLQQQHSQGSPTSSSSSSGSPVGEDLRFQHRTPSNTSLASSASAPPGNGTGMSGGGNSCNNSIRSSRSNNRLFPISTYTEIPSNNVSSSNGSNNNNNSSNNSTSSNPATPSGISLVDGSKQLSPHNWQSVAERINELEKHQLNNNNNNNNNNNSISGNSNNANPSKNLSQHTAAAPKPPLQQQQQQQQQQSPQKYTYFDPSKTHRVPNPSLKAFQKNAVISYFERQQAHARESNHNLSRPTTLNLHQQQQQLHSGSPPSLKSFSQRSSISSAYSSSGSTMDLTPSSQSPLAGNYHHHPSIVVQQQLDKIAANNLRNQLASVHTMNLLNKVQSPPCQQTAQLIESQMISNASLILSNDQTPDSDALDANGSPPPPPPRSRSIGMPGISNNTTMLTAAATHAAQLATVRRTSSASEYSSLRDQMIQQRQQLSKDLLGPMIMGPIIALDDWVPERPPKNPMLRIPSPELPPPPPMMSPTEDVVLLYQDEPLPPPPPEILRHIRQLSDSGEPKSNTTSRRNSFAGQTNKKSLYRASTFENLSPPPPGAPPSQPQISQLIIPPAVPKKPQPMDPQVIYRRPSSSMAKSQQPACNSPTPNSVHQAHRVVVNGKPDQRHSLPMQLNSPTQQFVPRQSDARVSMRKRSHNSQQIPVAEYLLKAVAVTHHQNGQMVPPSTTTVAATVATCVNNNNNNNNGGLMMMTSPPPPLKPRMSLQQQLSLSPLQDLQNGGPLISMGSKSCTGREHYDYRVTDHNNNATATAFTTHDNKYGYQGNHPRYEVDSSDEDDGDSILDCRRRSGSSSSISTSTASSSGSRGWLEYFSSSRWHLPPPVRKTLALMSNSKASYLPRQPRDKLHSDPDHGSYKLTLTSNEDSINHNDVFPEEIITSPKCNLPDVLPPGVKYSLYSNNNNNNNSNNNNNNNNSSSTTTTTLGGIGKPIVGKPPKTIPHSAPIISTNSLKSMFNFTPQQPQQNQVTPPSASSPVTPPPAYKPSSSSPSGGSPTNQAISPKYTSQSTFDLKKTQILDSKYLIQQHQQYPAQIGLPPAPAPPPPPPPYNESINNTNYFNHPHGGPNTTGCSQQTVNNCNEISEKSDSFESSISTGTTSTSTVEPVEANQNGTNTSKIGAAATYDGFAAQEEEDSISSNNTSICAEANLSNPIAACNVEESLTVVALERVTKEINLEPVVESSEQPPAAATKVVQRTEIVLRVAAPTSEASSQTDNELAAAACSSESNAPLRSPTTTSSSSIAVGIAELVIDHTGAAGVTKHSVATSTTSSPPSTPTSAKAPGGFFSKACTAAPRKVHPEEIDCDKLSHDLISQLSPSDKLHTILAPRPMKKDASTATPEVSPQKSPLDILTTSSTYFQVSEPKAKLMTRYSREMTLINGDCCDLTKKKEELVQRLGKKLLVLSNEQTSIAEESNANDMLGNDVALKVAQNVRPTDASKFRSYVDDVGYITMLLLSLSGRLARTDNALHNIDDSHPDKKILEAKRDRLLEQLEEAKQLKDDIDRRGAIISKILEKSLTIEEYADYDYFINMKAKLIVDSREIADKIKLGEEQLAALKDTLVQSEC